jgi:PIN domain nuclease of toxin-antitoxin system
MKLLLDTHVALWFWMGSERCPRSLAAAIADATNEVVFSQVSTWEIQLKFQQKKLTLPELPERFVPEAVRRSAFRYQPITDAAIFFLRKLPELHRDPFDRLLVAQAIVEGCTLATLDRQITPYPVPIFG